MSAAAPRSPYVNGLTIRDQLLLAAFWFGQNFLWGALVGPGVVKQITILQPENPASILWIPGTLGGIPALLIPLIAGPLSDRCTSPLGRRRPFLLWGSLLTGLCLVVMAGGFEARNLPLYIAGLILLGIPTNFALAAYSGIIPDLVPVHQRGLASGYMAVATQVGSLLGVLTGGFMVDAGQHRLLYVVLGSVYLAFSLASVIGVKETPLPGPVPKLRLKEIFKSLWIDPRAHPDFAWVWITRALMKLGFYMVIAGLLFYFGDVLKAIKPASDSAVLVAVALILATVSGAIGGKLSDVKGRKPIVMASSYAIAIAAILFLFCRSVPAAMVVGGLFGLAYGAYVSVDWALASDVLPNKDAYAKDMAVWHIAEVLPQQMAAILGNAILASNPGPLVERGGEMVQSYQFSAYVALFVTAAVLFSLGGFFIRKIKGAR